jgi:hypothetical protein
VAQPLPQDAAPAPDADVNDGNGLQVLTRGPIHEAFAEPVIFDPKAAPVVPKEPPAPVEEAPPAEKPEGANVVWIPGYWAWDDQRQDFVWVSGLWREVPPDRQWVPGYWSQVEGGLQWTPGFWAAANQEQLQYLPEPPASLESGPDSPPPAADAVWTPGTWIWQDNRYVWQPGSWVDFQQDWTWVPAHYVSTPSGYLFNEGYWDYPLAQRGQVFAPVYFQQPLYQQPGFTYTPSLALLATALASSLFVRPAYHQYYFGDYYDANNFQTGIYPWYSFHQSRYGYDPLFQHYSLLQSRRDPGWLNRLHDEYRYRREHPEARPAPTYAQQRAVVGGRGGNVAQGAPLLLAQPIRQVAARADSPVRFERLDEARRKELAARSAQLYQFREQRRQREVAAIQGRPQPQPQPYPQPQPDSGLAARRVALPRSPIARSGAGPGRGLAEEAHRRGPGQNPPPQPKAPGPDLSARPLPREQVAQRRFEPHPDRLPHQVLRPNLELPKAQPRPEAPKAEPRLERPKREAPPAAKEKEAAKKARRGG